MKYLKAFVASTVFVGTLFIVYVVHVRYLRVDVVLYSAIFDAVVAVVIAGMLLFRIPAFRIFSRFELTLLGVVWLLAGYTFAISVPTVIDRSLSFYILEKLQQRGGGILQTRMVDVITQEYVVEHRLLDVRLTEQIASGTLVIENGCVKLTERGDILATYSRFFRKHLLPKERLLLGEYTDALTDPFRSSPEVLAYRCR